jgi:hypothetical protein
MNDDRNPGPDPIGHATIPPDLLPFLRETPQAEEEHHATDPRMDAAFAQIDEAIGEDVQEINPDLGVGNASAYVGPAVVPDAAKGKAFTAKVKIIERHATRNPLPVPAPANDGEKDTTQDRAPPSSRGGLRLDGRTARLMAQAGAEKAAEESPWASDAAAVVPAAVLPSSHAPRGSAPKVESASPGTGGSRGRAIALAITALGIVVLVGVWVVARGSREVVVTPAPAGSGTATVVPAVPSARSSGSAVVAAPTAAPPIPLGTSEVDAGASVPTGVAPAPYMPKRSAVKGEDPYDAATPAPARTVEPVPPPPSATVVPAPTSSSWF